MLFHADSTGHSVDRSFADADAAAAAAVSHVTLGGLPIAVIDRQAAAEQMVRLAMGRPRGGRPLYFTSANGEVIARGASDPIFAQALMAADQIVADGQAMVLASRWLCHERLPERVATTDLFHDVARLAEEEGCTFYLLGATPKQNARAASAVRRAYPRLKLLGASQGYLSGEALRRKLAEINALAPDILWLGLGVPREHEFVASHAYELSNVGIIKTSGGLFDFLADQRRRAPLWMQRVGLEWLWRLCLEPRRLFMRYLLTNPTAVYLLMTRSR